MTDTNTRKADEAAIRRIVQSLADGWNSGDGAAFGAPFAPDADYMVWNGHTAKGRETIADEHQRIFDTIYKDTTMKLEVVQLRFLRDDVAVTHTQGGTIGQETWPTVRPTMVLTKADGQWQIAVFQNTPIMAHPLAQEAGE